MKRLQIRNSFILLLTAFIWGCSFVAQSVGTGYIGPLAFNAVRCLIGGLFLIPCIWLLEKRKKGEKKPAKKAKQRIELLKAGISCGIILFIGMYLQQAAIAHTSVGKSGFLTALYIVLVPIISIFWGKKSGKRLWAAVGTALIGLYLLCMKTGSFTLEMGDIMLLVGAVAFSFHIIVIDHFAGHVSSVKMSCIQFFVSGILSAVGAFLFEGISYDAVILAWQPLLYTGIFSCGVAYTLQIVGQRGVNPVLASLILSLESVISVIAGWAFLGESLTKRELLGCAVMFGAILLAQIPEKEKEQEETKKNSQDLHEETC